MGTYSLRGPDYAQGLFATDLRRTGEATAGTRTPLRFYDFLHLKHFFDYLKPRRQARLRQRVARRLARSVSPMRWHYRLLLHELLPQPGGGYVLVAEVYVPHYRYNSYGGYSNPYSSYGNQFYSPYSNYGGYGNARVFDGYQTTHAVVCGFDRSGNLVWDNTFVVENLRRTELEEAVRLKALPDGRFVLAYLDENKLRYKVVDHADNSPNNQHVLIRTVSEPIVVNAPENEHASETSHTELLPWYGTRFVASGYQHVRVAHGRDRDVFFLNTVAFH